MQVFVDDKMKGCAEYQKGVMCRDPLLATPQKIYVASLWMVPGIMNLMDDHEISDASGISLELLLDWRGNHYVNKMAWYNYKEFLEFAIDYLV